MDMGNMALTNRCERFIEEFGKDIIETYGIKADWVREQFLEEREAWHEVYLFVVALVDDDDVELMLGSPLCFAAGESDEDTIERVMELLDLDRETAVARLQRAELVAE
jgi:hypothetical protein